MLQLFLCVGVDALDIIRRPHFIRDCASSYSGYSSLDGIPVAYEEVKGYPDVEELKREGKYPTNEPKQLEFNFLANSADALKHELKKLLLAVIFGSLSD